MQSLAYFVAGLLFAIGLGVSGMTQPERITGFLNVLGDWDPSLVFVMAGATLSYFIGHLIGQRAEPELIEDRLRLRFTGRAFDCFRQTECQVFPYIEVRKQ